jgi:hypothetical protein
MQLLDLAMGLSTPSASTRKAYNELYEARPKASNVEARGVLFPYVEKESHKQQCRLRPLLRLCRCPFLGCLPFVEH